ncbi:MAG TPA: molybdate ABC transporter substrate-binding protein [Verrucomicrobiae bacterium]|jgi:molybdate transport system substrate-binding protein|nr:molybdate ABC transporter substrate-binding protein [Verrucomicrobiae bacterium]
MRIPAGLKFLLCLLLLCARAWDGSAASVTVFAAASLSDSLSKIAAQYEKESPDKIVFNFAASSLLARQIEEGAPADIFFSADEAQMDRLQNKGLILPETRKSRLSNLLVIIVAADSLLSISSPSDLAKPSVSRVALADPQAVPAGVYAREFLQKQNLWTAIEAKVVPTANVRGALAAVESGDVEAAVVYKTDAAISKKVKIAYEVPPQTGPNISEPMAVLKESPEPAAAKRFSHYLDSPAAGKVFEEFGFIVRDSAP